MLTEEGIEAKKLKKNVKILHKVGIDVQILTYFNPRQRVESASKRLKKAVFWARITRQDELFLVVILNTVLWWNTALWPFPRLPERRTADGGDVQDSTCKELTKKIDERT